MGTLKPLQALEGHTDRVWQVSWSPSGDMLASCSGDKTIRIWAREAGGGGWRCMGVLEHAHSRTVRSCCWSPSGRQLATAGFDRVTAIWEHAGGVWEQVAALEGHESEVKEVAWAPSGSLLATCSRDKSVWIWESQPGNEFEVVDVKHGHSQDVKTVRWHPSSELLVSASYDDSIKVWVESDDEWICAQTLAGPPDGHTSTVWELAFDAEGRRLVSCSDDATLKIWECLSEQGEPRWQLLATVQGHHPSTIFSVDWGQQGQIASGCADNAIRVFAEASAAAEPGTSPGASSCGGEGAVPSVRQLFLKQQEQQQQQWVLQCTHEQAHDADVNCVRWHPHTPGLLASAGDDGIVRLWLYTPPPASECNE